VVEQAVTSRHMTFARLPVLYEAAPVEVLVPTRSQALQMTAAALATGAAGAAAVYKNNNIDRYQESIVDGIAQTLQSIDVVVENCPNVQVILAGYSQGAIAVHDAENQLAKTGNPALQNIAGTLLLGDGDRTPHSAARRFGSSPAKGQGIRPYFNLVRDRDVPLPNSTAEICVADDVVCDFNLDGISWTSAVSSLKEHFAKATSVHTQYVRRDAQDRVTGFHPVLDDAAKWVAAKVSTPGIRFVGSPGTSAPPITLGPYTMTQFGPDPRDTDYYVSGVDDSFGNYLEFDEDARHELVGYGWRTWSHGYVGDVYVSGDSGAIRMILPPGTKAFYFYVEPDRFTDYDVYAETNGGVTSGMQTVQGDSGATYFGFYATGSATLSDVTVSASDVLAVGEFGIAY
jgi:hypothetical protein